MYRISDRAARILIVGAGALGCAALRTLAQERGIEITLVDDDRVELSNLQRQVLYTEGDIGRLKVEAAAERIFAESGASIRTIARRFDAAAGTTLVEGVDFVIDATDDPPTKFLINHLCVEHAKPFLYAGVARTGGQWMLVVPGVSACLDCVFPATPDAAAETAAGCSALGILAPVAGLVGAMQACVALAMLRSGPQPFVESEPGVLSAAAVPGRLHLYELTSGARSRHVDFPPREDCFCRSVRGDVPEEATRREP